MILPFLLIFSLFFFFFFSPAVSNTHKNRFPKCRVLSADEGRADDIPGDGHAAAERGAEHAGAGDAAGERARGDAAAVGGADRGAAAVGGLGQPDVRGRVCQERLSGGAHAAQAQQHAEAPLVHDEGEQALPLCQREGQHRRRQHRPRHRQGHLPRRRPRPPPSLLHLVAFFAFNVINGSGCSGCSRAAFGGGR